MEMLDSKDLENVNGGQATNSNPEQTLQSKKEDGLLGIKQLIKGFINEKIKNSVKKK